MNKIIAVITTIVASLTKVRVADVEEAAVTALVARLDKASKKSYDRAAALTDLAAEIAVKSSNERTYARDVSGLAGRLEVALNG